MDKFKQLSIINDSNDCIIVDNLVDNEKKELTYKGMKPSTKVKILTIPVDKSFLEGNLIEIPFICYFKPKSKEIPTTIVEFVWNDSKGIERKIEVRGSKWGVPDEFCFDVLVALFKIYQKQNQGIEFNYDENKWNMGKTIHFTFSELSKEMGYKSYGKNIFDRLNIALEILNDTKIYNKSGGSFLDIKTNEYVVAEVKESIGIIKNYRSYRYKKLNKSQKRIDYKQIKDITSVTLDDFLYESLCNSYFKIFDYDKYLPLKMGISKKIFLILNKWRSGRSRLFLKWETLYQKIPLRTANPEDDKPDKYKKKRIRDACKELIKVNCIKEVHETTIGIEFIFSDEKNKINEVAIDLESSYNTIPQIINTLNDINLNYEEVQKLLNNVTIDRLVRILKEINIFDIEKRKAILLELL